MAGEPEHVEHHVHDGLGRGPLAHRGGPVGLHPGLEALEAGHTAAVEGDEFAVEHRVDPGEGVGDAHDLGEAGGGVVPGP